MSGGQGLVFYYGSYDHQPGEVYPQSIEVRPAYSDRGIRWAKHVRYQVAGDILPTTPGVDMTQAQLTARIDAIEAAYDDDYKDFGFKLADGSTLTSHAMYTNGPYNLSGNRVLSLSFPSRLPSEYANTRSFSATLGALVQDNYSNILHFKETVTEVGTGGIYWTYRPLFNGLIVRENIHDTTPVRVVQQGVSVGLGGYPLVPPPYWPLEEQEWKRVITRESGRIHGHPSNNRGSHFTLRYKYEFLRAAAPSRSPALWG